MIYLELEVNFLGSMTRESSFYLLNEVVAISVILFSVSMRTTETYGRVRTRCL